MPRLLRTMLGMTALYLGLVGGPVFALLLQCCVHNYDAGIYGQALQRLSEGNLNPWLTVRAVHLFADHADPILFLAAPLAWVMHPVWAGVTFELACLGACALPVLWLTHKGNVHPAAAALGCALLMFNPAVIRAAHFPFHPTAWAALPLTVMGTGLLLRHKALALCGAWALMACKEEFPLVVGMAALVAFVLEERALSGLLLLSSLTVLGLDFVVRPAVMGSTVSYAAPILAEWERSPLDFLVGRVTSQKLLINLGSLLLVMVPLVVWMWRAGKRPNLHVLALALPLLAVRFVLVQWGHHYVPVLAVVLILAVVANLPHEAPPRWVWVTSGVLLLAVGQPASREGFSRACGYSSERLESIASAQQFLEQHPDGNALAEGSLVPGLVRRPNVYQLGGPQTPGAVEFRYVLIQRGTMGDTWPLPMERREELVTIWQAQPDTRVLRDDGHVMLLEGAFTLDR